MGTARPPARRARSAKSACGATPARPTRRRRRTADERGLGAADGFGVRVERLEQEARRAEQHVSREIVFSAKTPTPAPGARRAARGGRKRRFFVVAFAIRVRDASAAAAEQRVLPRALLTNEERAGIARAGPEELVENERGVSCPSPRVGTRPRSRRDACRDDAPRVSTPDPKKKEAPCATAPQASIVALCAHRYAPRTTWLVHVAVCPFERRGSRGQAHHLLELLDEDAPVAEQVLTSSNRRGWRDASKLRRISARISARTRGLGSPRGRLAHHPKTPGRER